MSWRNSRVSTAPGTELMPESSTVSDSTRMGAAAFEAPSAVASHGAVANMADASNAVEPSANVVTVGPTASRSPRRRTM